MTDNTVFMTVAETSELIAKIKELHRIGEVFFSDAPATSSDEHFLRYHELRSVPLGHDDAMLVLGEPISPVDCQRLIKAGGEMWEIEGISEVLSHKDNLMIGNPTPVLAHFVDLRCQRSMDYHSALGATYDQFNIIDVDYEREPA